MSNSNDVVWRKSSRSGANGQCVEVADGLGGGEVVAVRDSKDPTGGTLTFTARSWRAFTRSLRQAD